jgi:hypothetical protein
MVWKVFDSLRVMTTSDPMTGEALKATSARNANKRFTKDELLRQGFDPSPWARSQQREYPLGMGVFRGSIDS